MSETLRHLCVPPCVRCVHCVPCLPLYVFHCAKIDSVLTQPTQGKKRIVGARLYVAPKEPVEWCKARLQDGATFRIPKITEAEVYLALTKINTRKNVPTDGINAKYLKIAAANISKQLLTDIINTSLASNRFPEAWKVAKVFPVF